MNRSFKQTLIVELDEHGLKTPNLACPSLLVGQELLESHLSLGVQENRVSHLDRVVRPDQVVPFLHEFQAGQEGLVLP